MNAAVIHKGSIPNRWESDPVPVAETAALVVFVTTSGVLSYGGTDAASIRLPKGGGVFSATLSPGTYNLTFEASQRSPNLDAYLAPCGEPVGWIGGEPVEDEAPATEAPDEAEDDGLDDLSMAELRDIAKAEGAPTASSKHDLAENIREERRIAGAK